MKAIINGKIVLEGATVSGMTLLFDDKIQAFETSDATVNADTVIDAKGRYVLPGLVDMHIHGYLGEDASDGKAEGIRKMARGIAKNGVTSWLPTTMTSSPICGSISRGIARSNRASRCPPFQASQKSWSFSV